MNTKNTASKLGHNQDDVIRYDEKLISRLFYSLMPAAIVIALSSSVNSIVDGVVASNCIGNTAIAAIGYYNPFISILNGIGTVFSGGALIITGNRLGKGDEKGANSVFSTDLILSGLVFMTLSLLLFISAPFWAGVLGASDADSLANTASYIRGIAFSFVPMYLGNQISLFLEMEQNHTRNYIAIIIMVAINVVSDLIFVVILGLGCLGLGLATTMSCLCYFMILVQYYFTDKAQLKFKFQNLELTLLPQIVLIGAPGALVQIYLAFRNYIYNRSIIYYAGDNGMAAFAAVNSFGSVFYAFSNGIGVASRTLFSIFAGSEDRESIRTTMKVALFKAFPINVAIALVFTFCAPIFTLFYFNDSSTVVYSLALSLFRLCPLTLALSTVGTVFSSLYQCQGRMLIVNLISLTDGLLGVVISLIILCPFMGILGVWWSWLANSLLVMLVVLVYTLIVTKSLPRTLEGWLSFKDNFGVEKNKRLNFSVHDESEVVTCSVRVMDFLKARGRESKQVYYTGLALEEMAGNAITHGFNSDKKKHNVVIECVDMDDKLVLHIMDDCVSFDPLSKDLVFTPEDPTKNIGIRMVQRLSKEIRYYRMVGLNVLTIEL